MYWRFWISKSLQKRRGVFRAAFLRVWVSMRGFGGENRSAPQQVLFYW